MTSMKLILSRHGNTFGPGDKVVWTGLKNDLPLVKEGIKQAERLAKALQTQEIYPNVIYCAPLARTKHYAEIVAEKMGLPAPIADARLSEIDYGDWTGLTQDEVRDRFGEEALKGWDEQSLWPEQGNWGSSEAQVIAEVQSFLEHLEAVGAPVCLAITSNGRLRYFTSAVAGEFEKRRAAKALKVKTGHVCGLELKGESKLLYWNQDPLLTEL